MNVRTALEIRVSITRVYCLGLDFFGILSADW